MNIKHNQTNQSVKKRKNWHLRRFVGIFQLQIASSLNVLFISNLFPSSDEPVRGLDNATLLPHLQKATNANIRAIGMRPTLSPLKWGKRTDLKSRQEDASFQPSFVGAPYVPKIGSRWNHRLMRRAVRSSLLQAHKEAPIDVILCSWLYPDGVAVGELARELEIPYVLICQGSDAHSYLDDPTRRKAIIASIKGSQGVITRSKDLARRLVEASAPESKVHPIYNGVASSTFFAGSKSEARKELGLPLEGKILLFVGNFLPVKNPLLLIRAWRKSPEARDAKLIMLGSGPMEQQIIESSEDGDLSLPGRLPPSEVAKYMRAADLLCLSSHNEGVPNVVLEAFSSGLPVLSTDVGGISEVLDAPFLGALVPPDDQKAYGSQLSCLVSQEAETEAILSHSQQFTWQKSAIKYAEILHSAVASKGNME